MKAWVILNKRAGSVPSGELAREIESNFEESGSTAVVKLVDGSNLETLIREGLDSDADVVVSAGGDGTLRTVAGKLMGKQKPLGILPLGTVNQLARNLGIPINLKGAVETITKGRVLAIDMGLVNGEVFTCNVALGLPTYAMYAAENARKAGLPGKIVRAWRLLEMLTRLLFKLPVEYFEVLSDEKVIRDHETLVYVANNRLSLKALLTEEEENLSSGTLTLYIPRTKKRRELLRLFFMALTDRIMEAGNIDILESRKFTVRMKRRTIMASLDGEFIPMDTPLHFRSVRASLRIFVPPEAGA